MNRARWAALGVAAVVLIAACAPGGGGGGGGVGGNQSPHAVATADVTSGPAPLNVQFTGDASFDPDGTVATYAWNFGDGGTSTAANPSHPYATEGSYTASLLVTDNLGSTGLATIAIEVGSVPNQPPVAVPTATPSSGKVPLSVAFNGAGSHDTDGGTIVSYDWDFGDGTAHSFAQNTSHTYTTPGPFIASLEVTDNEGAHHTATVNVTVNPNVPPNAVAAITAQSNPLGRPPLTVDFTSAGSTDTAPGTIVSRSWDFHDGGSPVDSTATNPQHVYSAAGSYTATLTVTDDNGATDSDDVTVTVTANQAPIAQAGASTTTGQAPLAVTFNSTGTVDNDGTIASYSWNFGDSSSSGVASPPPHTYTAAGTYHAVLTVTDNEGGTDTDQVTITVGAANQAPSAAASATPTTIREDRPVSFSSAGTGDSDGTITGYAWTFGDGGTSTSANPSYSYPNPGNYTATLTVTDNQGATDSDTVSVTVTANQSPVATASANPTTAKTNITTVNFTSSATDADGGTLTYLWNFGDSQTSGSQNTSHVYATPGSKTATLTVTDDLGATDVKTVVIQVNNNIAPNAVVNATPQSGPRLLNVSFQGDGSNDPDGTISTYAWTFGDGGTSSAINPSHSYAAGTYTATLTVTDNNGATNAATIGITVVIDDDADGVSPPTDCNDTNAAINPGAADPLDGVDNNCDGVDGVAAQNLYVTGSGVDNGTCGTLASPCRQIAQGQTRALATGKTNVLVGGGASYTAFTLTNGLSVSGGYAAGFASRSGTTTVTAAVNAAVGGSPVGIIADNLSSASRLSYLTVSGITASANLSSYGIVVRNSGSNLTIDNVTANAGAGGASTATGTAGTGASQTAPTAAGTVVADSAENSWEITQACSNTIWSLGRRLGGLGAGAGTGVRAGGTGGQGGSISTSYPTPQNCAASAGLVGSAGGGGAAGGTGGAPDNLAVGGAGGAGVVGTAGSAGANGTAGVAGAGSGSVNGSGLWVATGNGGTGGAGADGAGGGGGGGGGGSDDTGGPNSTTQTNDDVGGGGGGGGQGGVAATSAGTGGGQGGASIGLLIYNSSPTLTAVTVNRAAGGNGAAGGAGALGQPGGAGGPGGFGNCNGVNTYTNFPKRTATACPTGGQGGVGGAGGAGGAGGKSAGGGGGAGGPSIGVVLSASSSSTAGVTFSGGTGGTGGAGGAAASGGSAGTAGATGAVVTVATLP